MPAAPLSPAGIATATDNAFERVEQEMSDAGKAEACLLPTPQQLSALGQRRAVRDHSLSKQCGPGEVVILHDTNDPFAVAVVDEFWRTLMNKRANIGTTWDSYVEITRIIDRDRD